MDKLTALTVFRRVAELRSFSQAARELRLSNTAVSKNVRELEQELGTRLLHRTTRTVHLTSSGEAYHRRIADLLDRLDEADADASERADQPRGLLKVAAPVSLGIALIAPAIATFANAHPAVKIDLDMNDRYVDLVDEGFDLGLRGGGPLPDSSLIGRKLFVIERILCAAPSYLARHGRPTAPEDLAAHRCLVYSLSRTATRWTLRRARRVRPVEIDSPLHVNNSLALVRAAVAGAGIVLVPRVTAEHELASGSLVPVLRGWTAEPQALYAVYPQHRQASSKVRLLIEHLAAHLGRAG